MKRSYKLTILGLLSLLMIMVLAGCPIVLRYTVTVTSHPLYNMKIAIDGIEVTTPVTRNYNEGQTITLAAKNNEGYEFDRWVINGISYNTPSRSFSVTQNINAQVFFTESPPAVITGRVSPYIGSVVPAGSPESSQTEVLKSDIRTTWEFPEEEYVPGEFIVIIDPFYSMKSVEREITGVFSEEFEIRSSAVSADGSLQFMVVAADDGDEARLKEIPGVVSVERNYIFRTMEENQQIIIVPLPNDPLIDDQWGLDMMNLPRAWHEITTGSQTVVVAVLDTGVRFNHPDLVGIYHGTGWDFVSGDSDPTDHGNPSKPSSFSHGTHVTGTIAALTDNNKGVAGVAWGGVNGVRILPVRVLDSVTETGDANWVASGIIYAVDQGARVINLSLGSQSDSSVIKNAIKYAYANDVVVVAAAGNNGGAGILYPARYPETIAVGAVGPSQVRASYSNTGPQLDVVAPGGQFDILGNGAYDTILSTAWSISGEYAYGFMQGTSMATPHVSGLVALLMSRGVTGVENIRSILRSSAKDLGTPGFNNEYGYGLVDAYQALLYAGVGNPIIVFTYDVLSERVDDIAYADEYGNFLLDQVQGRQVELYMWQDSDGDTYPSVGDLLGYYGYTGGDPGHGTPMIISTAPGGFYTRDFSFAPILDTTTRPSIPVLSDSDLRRINEFIRSLGEK